MTTMGALKTIDQERLVIDATSGGVGFDTTKALQVGIYQAVCTVEAAQIRVMSDPDLTLTAGGAVGSRTYNVGDGFVVRGYDSLKSFKAIRTGGTSGDLQVRYEGID